MNVTIKIKTVQDIKKSMHGYLVPMVLTQMWIKQADKWMGGWMDGFL